MPYDPAEQGNQVPNDVYKCHKCGHSVNVVVCSPYGTCELCLRDFILANVPQMVKV